MVKFGQYLALKTVEYLIENKQLSYYHRDYCGTGFYYDDNKIYYTEFNDGLANLINYRNQKSNMHGVIKEFTDFESFKKWLAEQTDESLNGKELLDDFYLNNQRITKQRLQELFAYNVLNHKDLD